MKLAETVFVFPPAQGGDVRVRIFTPSTELPFAGHPVLGTAFVVGALDTGLETVRIETELATVPVAVRARIGHSGVRADGPAGADRDVLPRSWASARRPGSSSIRAPDRGI